MNLDLVGFNNAYGFYEYCFTGRHTKLGIKEKVIIKKKRDKAVMKRNEKAAVNTKKITGFTIKKKNVHIKPVIKIQKQFVDRKKNVNIRNFLK